MTDNERLQVECLTAIQAFETLWAYFIQSDGELFSDQCLSACATVLKLYDELLPSLPAIGDPAELNVGVHTDIGDVLKRLRRWVDGSTDLPYGRADESRFMLFAFFTGLKQRLSRELGVAEWPAHMTSAERNFSSPFVRWRGHLPTRLLANRPAKLLAAASASDTIAVLGDIRRSQDLMTYATSPAEFSSMMQEFVKTTRVLAARQVGIFDKFTGDGFLVYFNEALCKAAGEDYLGCFFWFLEAYQYFTNQHFERWGSQIRKMPADGIGISIGADIGRVTFVDLDGHLVAVGDPIVWASRLAASGAAKDVLVNNLLAVRMRGRPRVSLEPCPGRTKTGEDFLAHRLTIDRKVSDARKPQESGVT